jgi:hypothetical protein
MCGCCGWKGPSNQPNITNKDWIDRMIEINPKIPIRDMTILGTHDSATGSISPYKCCSALAITTRFSLYEQLCAGARYLDIRLGQTGPNPWDINIFHGPISGGKYCTSVSNSNNGVMEPAKFGQGVPGKF